MSKHSILSLLMAVLFGSVLCIPAALAEPTDNGKESTEQEAPSVVPAALMQHTPIVNTKVNTKAKVFFIYQSRSLCGICVHETPEIVKLYKKMHGKGAELIMINVDATPDAALTWAKKAKMKFPIYFHNDAASIPFPYEGEGLLPCMVAVDADGNKLGEANASNVVPFLKKWKQLVKQVEKEQKEQQKDGSSDPS